MKYQHIIDREVIFETNIASEFAFYILDHTSKQCRVLTSLLQSTPSYSLTEYKGELTEADFWDGDESANFLQ